MLHELHSTLGESGGIFLRPYIMLGLLEDGPAILDDEAKIGVEL